MISNRISKHNILFLQHGVTALKRVHPIFGMKGSSPMTHFTTTSRFEHKIIVENFGYEDGDAPILGFTRWDVLEDTSKPEEKIILAMPTSGDHGWKKRVQKSLRQVIIIKTI